MAPTGSSESSTKALNERFFRYFQQEVTALQEQIDRLSNIPTTGGERTDAIDHCLAGIARLSAEVKDASVYVPPYDQRTYADAIKALSEKLQNTRNSFAPKAKFAFSSGVKKNPSAISLTDAAELAASQRLKVPGYSSASTSPESSVAATPANLRSPTNEPVENPAPSEVDEDIVNKQLRSVQDYGVVRKPSFSKLSKVSLSNHTGLHIILPSSASHATTSGTLSHLRNCIVDMSTPTSTGHPFAGLTLRDVHNSLIVCGHVAGPIHITSVHDSVLVVAARQFRMHDSQSVDVYLQTVSRPIIEDCERIRFAPLPECYATENSSKLKNMWDQVDDFKWLKAEASPHWSILPEDRRIDERVWKEIVPGQPGVGLEEILKAVRGST